MCLAHRDSRGRLVEIASKSRSAKSDCCAVSRAFEGRHDSSAHLDRDRSRQDSGNDIGDVSNCAFHSGQGGDGFTMVQSHSYDTFLERADHLSLEISRPTGRDSSRKIVRLNKRSSRIILINRKKVGICKGSASKKKRILR